MNITGVHHIAASVKNMDESVQFYERLGFRKKQEYHAEDNSLDMIHLELSGVLLELFYFPENSTQSIAEYERAKNIGIKHIGLETKDIQQTFEMVGNAGLLNADQSVSVGKTGVSFFFIKDPNGIWVEFIQDKEIDA